MTRVDPFEGGIDRRGRSRSGHRSFSEVQAHVQHGSDGGPDDGWAGARLVLPSWLQRLLRRLWRRVLRVLGLWRVRRVQLQGVLRRLLQQRLRNVPRLLRRWLRWRLLGLLGQLRLFVLPVLRRLRVVPRLLRWLLRVLRV